ncbi:MAG: DEAD/DEAH box helicase family protein [Bacteroidales bacterium]|nr:DEAD/DEAH box helicase family protein [Bacteroidales bacterium]
MDKIEAAANVIIAINKYRDHELHDYELIPVICSYFDQVKSDVLSDSDKQFLYYIANEIGIPQYFDTLIRFNQNTTFHSYNLNTISGIFKEASLYTSVDSKLHKYQKDILDRFEVGKPNRFFLSASTSFGKTFLVYEIIRKMQYKNILLVFPSIALLSENLEKIMSDEKYRWIQEIYKIHTMSMIEEIGDKNICIFTPERYLSFLDVSKRIPFDFVFVDEVYKMDNEYVVDEETRENERDIAYRLALHYVLQSNLDVFLAGPYIEFSQETTNHYNPSFDRFLQANSINLLNYNKYEIVNKEYKKLPQNNKIARYKTQIKDFIEKSENVIVYCSRRSDTERYANYLVGETSFPNVDTSQFTDFLEHLSKMFKNSNNWIVVKALKKGIGVHHGLIPKYIQKEIIELFNKGFIRVLLSTTTITEGVNTTAKNVLVLSSKKGDKPLKKFDALNIEGRAGRFLQHYKGIVYSLDKDFEIVKNGNGEPIKHKNYDDKSPKDDIDLFFTDEQFLNQTNIDRKRVIEQLQIQHSIPDDIINQFKVISKEDKIRIYEHICNLSPSELTTIKNLIQHYQIYRQITYEGVEIIINIALPFVKNQKLRALMTLPQKGKDTKILTALLYSYFRNGLRGMINYNIEKGEPIQDAVKNATDFVYNILKYQVVKYFGAFNLMYKFYLSKKENRSFNQITGIDAILLKMEFNANTEKGRLASDYGVPQKVLEYYDSNNDVTKKNAFDSYENYIFEKVERIINNK